MTAGALQWLFWTPRILGILFAIFISLFALDVFGEGYGFWGTVVALVMHLVPTFIVLVVLAVAWRWPSFSLAWRSSTWSWPGDDSLSSPMSSSLAPSSS